MPILDQTGEPVAQSWTVLADDAAMPAQGDVIVSLTRLAAEAPMLKDHDGGLGVLVPPDATRAAVAPFLDILRLIAIEFPKFRDGRGFSLARGLREQNGFAGEIRAVGHVLPDQFVALLRCGVTSVEVADGQRIASWQEIFGRSGHKSAASDDRSPLPLLRRIAVPFTA